MWFVATQILQKKIVVCRIHELLSFVFTLYTVYMHILHVSVLNILTTRVQYNRDKSYSSLIKQITKSMQVIGEATL